MTREDDAKRFAEAMGWRFNRKGEKSAYGATYTDDFFVMSDDGHRDRLDLLLPSADAPLHEHLGFVGRVAEALAPEFILDEIRACGGTSSGNGVRYSVDFMSTVTPGPGTKGGGFSSADDLSWSAMNAAERALSAKGGSRGR